MIVFPNAKINLGLQVLRKRSDGFHNIDSVFLPIPVTDALEIVLPKRDAGFEFSSSGLAIDGPEELNLCIRAYRLLAEEFSLPAMDMHLLKKIPMGAGIGGGSADGAFSLRLINSLCQLNLSKQALESYALMLGSDCPFFIENTPKHITGRGEKMEDISITFGDKKLLLLLPQLHISTQDAYAGITPQETEESCKELVQQPIEMWRNTLKNDFEQSAFAKHPQLASIKEKLYASGALYASMTGSGSTMYGIFENETKLDWTSDLQPLWTDLK